MVVNEGLEAGASEMETYVERRQPKERGDMPREHQMCLSDCVRGECWKYTAF